ncbi:MAG TPA: 2Fe-2S iron-sulfur cluster-binding protein [Planctomycetota bacterium]|jgi:NADH-quinone oxidoreductase subunit G|nr:hypothetical protein [Planctomycetaceae bacterium]HJM55894.1 2Fe-2S iron-sulfur cluster-binding protein [Planctomycetota bacterium]
MTKIIVNGREVEADPQKPLIAACHNHGEHVPHYCYHPGLSAVGSCRICQVEVKQGEMPARVVAACRTPVAEGMVVNTDSEGAHGSRRECLEFLLKNHPLDCPICDKAGECSLQDYSFQEAQAEGRSSEPRRKLEKRKDLGDVILLDQERCILCSRCVRFMEEVPKSPQLCIGGRGSHSVVETWQDTPLSGNYQGNLADVCPVGALTLKDFRFQARVWNLTRVPSTCSECSRGCSISVEVLRNGEVKRMRPRPNEDVNSYWMCDHGRFSEDELNRSDRMEPAALRDDAGQLTAADPVDALRVVRNLLSVQSQALFLASPYLTVEEGEALSKLARSCGTQAAFFSPEPNDLRDDVLHTGDPCPNQRGLQEAGLTPMGSEEWAAASSSADCVLLLGERLLDMLGDEALGALPPTQRLVVMECRASNHAAVDVAMGIPNRVERSGTWVNVDGTAGAIRAARSAPQGVRALVELLADLTTTSGQPEEALSS